MPDPHTHGWPQQHEPAALHTQLRIKMANADEASEDVVALFRNGDLNATDFLKQFQEQRKVRCCFDFASCLPHGCLA